MRRYKNGATCPACARGALVQIGLVQKCDTCDTLTMVAENAVPFADLRNGEEFVFEYYPETVFVKGKPENAPDQVDISSIPDILRSIAEKHNKVVMHIKGNPQQYGFCSQSTRVVRADERRIYGVVSWN